MRVDCSGFDGGRGKHRVDYRHIIDWLVRKPGAFESYRYREDLFPTSRFRMAYDALRESGSAMVSRHYLEILEMAAREGEDRVDRALRVLLESGETIDGDAVRDILGGEENIAAITEVAVTAVDLRQFDELFTCAEVVQ